MLVGGEERRFMEEVTTRWCQGAEGETEAADWPKGTQGEGMNTRTHFTQGCCRRRSFGKRPLPSASHPLISTLPLFNELNWCCSRLSGCQSPPPPPPQTWSLPLEAESHYPVPQWNGLLSSSFIYLFFHKFAYTGSLKKTKTTEVLFFPAKLVKIGFINSRAAKKETVSYLKVFFVVVLF